jgi:hypothetical protein
MIAWSFSTNSAARETLNDYSGDVVSEEEASACIRSAEALLTTLTNWLKQNRKEWTQ